MTGTTRRTGFLRIKEANYSGVAAFIQGGCGEMNSLYEEREAKGGAEKEAKKRNALARRADNQTRACAATPDYRGGGRFREVGAIFQTGKKFRGGNGPLG